MSACLGGWRPRAARRPRPHAPRWQHPAYRCIWSWACMWASPAWSGVYGCSVRGVDARRLAAGHSMHAQGPSSRFGMPLPPVWLPNGDAPRTTPLEWRGMCRSAASIPQAVDSSRPTQRLAWRCPPPWCMRGPLGPARRWVGGRSDPGVIASSGEGVGPQAILVRCCPGCDNASRLIGACRRGQVHLATPYCAFSVLLWQGRTPTTTRVDPPPISRHPTPTDQRAATALQDSTRPRPTTRPSPPRPTASSKARAPQAHHGHLLQKVQGTRRDVTRWE